MTEKNMLTLMVVSMPLESHACPDGEVTCSGGRLEGGARHRLPWRRHENAPYRR
jgi:hypothetical protein